MILWYCIASYVVVFFTMRWYVRNVRNAPVEFTLLSGLLWMISPVLIPAVIVAGLGWSIGLLITRGYK